MPDVVLLWVFIFLLDEILDSGIGMIGPVQGVTRALIVCVCVCVWGGGVIFIYSCPARLFLFEIS